MSVRRLVTHFGLGRVWMSQYSTCTLALVSIYVCTYKSIHISTHYLVHRLAARIKDRGQQNTTHLAPLHLVESNIRWWFGAYPLALVQYPLYSSAFSLQNSTPITRRTSRTHLGEFLQFERTKSKFYILLTFFSLNLNLVFIFKWHFNKFQNRLPWTSLAETPENWNWQFHQDKIFADNL